MWDLINSDSAATMAMGIDGVRVTGLPGTHDTGVRVSTVAPDSPAARAGLRPDDVIVAMDGHAVSTLTAVLVFAHDRSDGHEVMIDLLRNGKATKLALTK
jgi:S1-C subfamily serine protease